MITTGTGINLKKYSVDNLADFDLEYTRIDNEQVMKFHYDVIFNKKKIGEIHARHRSGMSSGVEYDFKPVNIVDAKYYFPIVGCYRDNLTDVKKSIEGQILGIAKFIMKFYENK